jgi:uncharacterized membrane protein (DUF106 family)
MSSYAIVLILSITLVIGIWSGLLKTLSRSFNEDPASPALHSSEMKEKQTSATESLQERNQKMMEQLKTRMERNRRP